VNGLTAQFRQCATPEKRAQQHYSSEQYEQLIESAPDALWKGLGEYKQGDYTAAAESFQIERDEAAERGMAEAVSRAAFNQGNAHLFNEQYGEAINAYDSILAENPEHVSAKHNRAIAEKLLQQQQQQSQQQDGESGEQTGEQQQSDGSQNQEQNPSQQQQDSQNQEQQTQSNDSSSTNNADQPSAQQDASGSSEQNNNNSAADAEAAMSAEQNEANNNDGNPDEQSPTESSASQPLSEREQANEQWLRQIPDDPAGLLQNKIQNRHMTDYPKVQDSATPW